MTILRTTPPGLNLRAGPGRDYAVVGLLPRGTLLEQQTREGEWVRVHAPGGVDGWVSAHYTQRDATPWYTLAAAELGVREIPGARHNPRILEYHASCTLRATSDEVPWCSAFVNWCMAHVGLVGTRLANARSWLLWGRGISVPVTGCIVVLARGSDPLSGHVGLFVGREGDRIRLLGGNQGNRVSEATFAASRVLGYRMPREA